MEKEPDPQPTLPRISILVKIALALVALWIVVWALALLIPIPVLGGFITPLAFLGGVGLLIFSIIATWLGRPRKVPAILLVVILGVGSFGLLYGFETAARINFRVRRGHFERKTAQVLATADPEERKRICGDECFMLSGDRVAFHYVHGFLSWYDFVYDPTGAMMERDFMKKKEINMYFIGAEPLAENWYLAHFGD